MDTRDNLIKQRKSCLRGMQFLGFNDWDSLGPIEHNLIRITKVLEKRYGVEPVKWVTIKERRCDEL